MAQDATSICNLALAHLSESQIMSLDDESKQARWCKTFYAQTRDEVLAEHPWNFAIRRAVLSRLAETPLFQWAFQYQLPTACLRVLELNNVSDFQADRRWAIEGRALLTDDEGAQIRYIHRVESASDFAPLFVEALAVKLASKLAKPLTGNKTAKDDLMTEYARITGPRAKQANAVENRLKVKQPGANSPIIHARR